jgi:hypothetical protein
MDAVATAEIFMVFFPNRAINVVGMLADSLTCTAFAGEPVPHVPLASSMFRHFVVTDVVTVPMYETALLSPVEALKLLAYVVAPSVVEVLYTTPAAASTEALA